MAMARTAFRTGSALLRLRTVAANWSQRAKMPLFQVLLHPYSSKVTDGHCIKDATTIDIIVFKNGKKRPTQEGVYPVYGGNGILGFSNEFNLEKGIAIGRVGM